MAYCWPIRTQNLLNPTLPRDSYVITELTYIHVFNMFTLKEKQWRREVVSVQVKEFFNAQCFEKLSRSCFCNFISADLTIFGEYVQSETFPLRQRTLTFAIMENEHITTCVLNAFLSYTAVILNCLTIRALTKLSSLPRPLKTLLLSLAVSDLGVGLMVQPSYIATLVMEMEQKTENNPAYNITYKFYVFTVNLFGYASLFGVTFLSLDRFLAVYLHLRYQELVTHKRVVVVMVSKWVFSAVLSFLRLWIPTRVSFIIFAIISLSLLLTTTPINYKIYVSGRHHANQIQALQVQPTANQSDEAGTRNIAGWRKFAFGTLLVYLAFLVCYLPNFCFLIVYLISGPSSSTTVLDLFSSTLLFLNSTLNPLIYCWKMRRIRLTILTILRNIFQRWQTIIVDKKQSLKL